MGERDRAAGAGIRSGEALAYVVDVDAPALDEDDDHHLRRVRRLRAGAALVVADGAGRWRPARLGSAAGRVEPDGPVVEDPAPARPLAVAFAPPKGDRPELVVQKLTELGLDRIVVYPADRSVVRHRPDRQDRFLARLRRVARQAGAQSRRSRLPVVDAADDLDAVVAVVAGVAGTAPDGRGLGPADTALVVGPEGGFTERELALLPAPVGLGPHVLRAETAAIAAGALLVAVRDGRVASGL